MLNATLLKGVTSTVHPALSLLVLQFQWRKSIGSVSSAKFLQELSRAFTERGRSWRKKLTLQLLTIYMILGMIVMMLKMMMLMMMTMMMVTMWWWWWWWWRWWWWRCDDDDDDDEDEDDVHYHDEKTSSFLKRRWCIFTCRMCKIIVSL